MKLNASVTALAAPCPGTALHGWAGLAEGTRPALPAWVRHTQAGAANPGIVAWGRTHRNQQAQGRGTNPSCIQLA